MTSKILLVDDEENVLHALARNFRLEFEMETALGPLAALSILKERGPYAVVVSDLRMPDMDGIQLLCEVRRHWPDTVRIILSGNADLQSVIASVNEGSIFQFVTKPCPLDRLRAALAGALKQHELVVTAREILEHTLNGSAAMMAEVLSMVSQLAFGRASRLRGYVQHMVRHLQLENFWEYDLAAILSQIGCIAVPTEILEKVYSAAPLSPQEKAAFLTHPVTGHKLLANIPRLEVVAEIILYQLSSLENIEKLSLAKTVKCGAQMLLIASRVDETVSRGGTLQTAVQYMTARPTVYQPALVAAITSVEVQTPVMQTRAVAIDDLRTGMTVNEDLCAQSGLLIVAKGQVVSEALIARLQNFRRTAGLKQWVSVLAQASVSKTEDAHSLNGHSLRNP